jgi:hypothetical protein
MVALKKSCPAILLAPGETRLLLFPCLINARALFYVPVRLSSGRLAE